MKPTKMHHEFDKITSDKEKKQYLKALKRSELEEFINPGIRHHPEVEGSDYLENWLRVARLFAYATPDGTWGELEKELGIILTNYVWHKLHP